MSTNNLAISSSKKKLALPDSLTVLGVRFRVELVQTVDEEGSDGETVGALRRIRIADWQDTRRQWTTLLHEWAHAVMHVVGAGNVLPEELEEVLAQSLEHALEQFMLSHGKQYLEAISQGE